MLSNNHPTDTSSYTPNLHGLAEWINDNTSGGDHITRSVGQLLRHIAAGYGGLFCDGLHADKYMRRANGRDHHQILVRQAKRLLFACLLNYPRTGHDPEQAALALLRQQLSANPTENQS
jgi:hypothetical protein